MKFRLLSVQTVSSPLCHRSLVTRDTVTNRGTRRWISGYLVWLDKGIMFELSDAIGPR